MASHSHRLPSLVFEKLRDQVATASALCAEDQILDLADVLHDSIRRRRVARFGAFAEPRERQRLHG